MMNVILFFALCRAYCVHIIRLTGFVNYIIIGINVINYNFSRMLFLDEFAFSAFLNRLLLPG